MEVKLVVVGGDAAQASEFAIKLPTVIGRSRTADLPLANPLVSRRHCEIFEANGQLMVRDLGSLNGTFVGKDARRRRGGRGAWQHLDDRLHRAARITWEPTAPPMAAAAPAAVEKPAAAPGSDESTVSVDELETLEPMGEGADDAEFDLAWLEEGSGRGFGRSRRAHRPVRRHRPRKRCRAKARRKKAAPAKAAAPTSRQPRRHRTKSAGQPIRQSGRLERPGRVAVRIGIRA